MPRKIRAARAAGLVLVLAGVIVVLGGARGVGRFYRVRIPLEGIGFSTRGDSSLQEFWKGEGAEGGAIRDPVICRGAECGEPATFSTAG